MMDLVMWVNVAQVVTAIVAVIGVFISIWYSLRSLKEVKGDRITSVRPFLVFDETPIIFDLDLITKNNKDYIWIPKDASADSVDFFMDYKIGKLINLGVGAAVNIRTIWLFEYAKIDGKDAYRPFGFDQKYFSDDNIEIKITPNFIISGNTISHNNMPLILQVDSSKKIQRISGVVHLIYEDVFGYQHTNTQKFYFINKPGTNPNARTFIAHYS